MQFSDATRQTVRVVIVSIALAIMWAGPFARQVLGVPVPVRTWQMFSGKGLETCHTRFFQRDVNGRETELDRFEVLGYGSKQNAPKKLWRVRDRGHVRRVAWQLCEKLGSDADVRVYRRCADRKKGWKSADSGKNNVCLEEKKEKGRKGPHPQKRRGRGRDPLHHPAVKPMPRPTGASAEGQEAP